MITWENIHRVLEVLYLLSGVAVAVLAALGLKQLSLAKRSIEQNGELARTSARRESYKLAAEQCQRYLEQVIPLLNASDKVLIASGAMEQLEKFQFSFSGKGFKIQPESSLDQKKLRDIMLGEDSTLALLEAANALEAFSVLFTSGVAAEKVAFGSVGKTFCNSAKNYVPALLPYTEGGHFENMFQLLYIWQRRIDIERLRSEQSQISQKLGEAQEIGIRPMGT